MPHNNASFGIGTLATLDFAALKPARLFEKLLAREDRFETRRARRQAVAHADEHVGVDRRVAVDEIAASVAVFELSPSRSTPNLAKWSRLERPAPDGDDETSRAGTAHARPANSLASSFGNSLAKFSCQILFGGNLCIRRWFVAIDDKKDGPFSDERLRELIAGGTVTADTLVWCNGMTNWTRAAEVPGLMAGSPRQASLPPRSGPAQNVGRELAGTELGRARTPHDGRHLAAVRPRIAAVHLPASCDPDPMGGDELHAMVRRAH